MMLESTAPCDDHEDHHDAGDAAGALNADDTGKALLAEMVAGSLGPLSRLRDSVDLTLDQVSQWIAQPDNRRRIVNLVTLLDAQSQLLACQYRVLAISRLVELAGGKGGAAGPETVRRACADLLRLRLINPYQEDKRPPHACMPPPVAEPPISEERILAALEELGREAGA